MTSFSEDVTRMVSRQVAVAARGYVRAAQLHVAALQRAVSPATRDGGAWARDEVAALRSTLDAFAVLAKDPEDRVPLDMVVAAACLLASGYGAHPVRAQLEPAGAPDVVDAAFIAQRLADRFADLAEPRTTVQARWVRSGARLVVELSSSDGVRSHDIVLDAPSCREARFRLLVVDDDVAIRTSLRRRLRRDGHVVVTAATAEDALEAIQGAQFDAVISDVDMPGMDGLEMLEALRVVAPELAARLVFVTGRLGDATLRARLARSGAPFFAKPADVVILMARIVELTCPRSHPRAG